MAAPRVGEVQDGYRFKGGNPADPANWQRLPPEQGEVMGEYRFLGGNPADPSRWSKVSEEGGFWSTLIEGAQSLGLADEATAFAANPNEANRKALLAAGESKKRSVGFGEGADWVAFKQLLGGSIGEALAPLGAGIGASFVGTPLAGLSAFSGVAGTQYTAQNLLRQAQEQERALQEGRTPEETSVTKAVGAAIGQTGLDLLGGRVFKGVAKAFPFARPLLGKSGGKAAEEVGDVLADAFNRGTVTFVGGVARGVGKGVAFEIPQEIAQSGLERWQAGLSLTDDDALGEYKQAAIGAALLGGSLGGVSGGIESLTGERPAPTPTPVAAEGVAIPQPTRPIDDIVARALVDPEDRAAFEVMTKEFSELYGIPEEKAAELAFGALRPTQQAATPASEEAAPVGEPTLVGREAVPPVMEPAAAPPQVVEPVVEPVVAPVTAPAAPEPMDIAAPVAAAPVAEPMAAPEPVLELLPVAKKKVTPERIQIATQMLTQAAQGPDFEGLDITPKELNKAAQQLVRNPELGAEATLASVLGIDTAIAQEDAFEAAAPEVEAVPEPEVVEEAAPGEEPVVPVTKVAPGVARGVAPVQRGTQGTQRGRPVEGAAQLTEGMRAQQALTADIEAAREAREVSDADVAATLDYLRPPTSEQEMRALSPERRNQWLEAINAQREVDAMQERVSALPREILGQPNPERADLEITLGNLQGRLNTIQQDIVGSARTQFEALRSARKQRVSELQAQLRSGQLSPAEAREARIELRESRVSRAESDIVGERTELAQQLVAVAQQAKSIREVIEFLAQQDTPLGRVAARLLPIVPDVRVTVASPEVVRDMAKRDGERIEDVPFVEGVYVPKRKTIFLRNDMVLDHVPLHETLHPIIDGHIERGTPAGRELKAIYTAFKAQATPEQQKAYGFTDAHEFVAEVWGNAQFRALLQELSPGVKVEKSLLQRVVDAIKRIFRSMLKSGADPVIDYVERVMQVTEAAAAAPVSDTEVGRAGPTAQKINRGLYKAQMANTAAGFNEGIDAATAGAKLEGKERRQALLDAMRSSTAPIAFQFQPTSWIREGIERVRPGLGSVLNSLDKLEQNMRGMRTSMQRALGRRTKEFERFVNANGQGIISAMMTIARVNRVDVTAYSSRAEALANDKVLKHYADNNNAKGVKRRTDDINTAWDMWEKLGKQPGGHETYKMVRKFYKDMYAALRAAQDEDIRNLGLDKATTERLIMEARGDVEADGVVEDGEYAGVPEQLFPQEYFPFRRFGEHVLIVQNGKRAERERYHFESARERNEFEAKRAKELGLKRGTTEYGAVFRQLDGLENLRDNMSEESFLLGKLFEAVDDIKEPKDASGEDTAKFKKSLKDRLYQTYLMTLPERNLRKQFIHAELITGQSADALRVFRVAASQYSSQLPKIVYGNKIQTQIEAAYDTASEGDPAEVARLRKAVDAIVGRVRETMDPAQQGKVEQFISGFTFLSLMTSVASAAVQPLTLVFQVMPRMVSRYGPVEALRMVSSYTPLLSVVDTVREVDPVTGERWLVAPTLGNVKYIKNNPLRARLWDELDTKRDLFSQKQTDMILRNRATPGTQGDTLAGRVAGGYERVVNVSGALFSSADQITRELSGMAFAELEYDKLRKQGKSHEQAVEGAVDAAVRNTNETIGNYTEVEKLDVFRGNMLKRMIGFLRTYSVQRTAYYFRMLNALTKGDPTQSRLQAFGELSMVLVFTALGAGISANFGYEFICDLLDTIIPLTLSDDEMEEWRRRDPLGADDADYRFRFQWIPEQFGPDSLGARIAQRGALSELTGWDWTTRLSQSSLWLRDFRGGATLREDIVNFLVANLSPQVSQSANIIDGIDEFLNGNWSKGFTKIMPAAVRGAFTAERFGSEGETTKAGRTVMGAGEFDNLELFGQVLGFAPNDLARVREINRTTQAYKRSMEEERGKLFEEYRKGLIDRDREAVDATLEKIRRYNAKVPLGSDGLPLSNFRIEPRDLMQSLRSTATRTSKTYRGVEYAPGEGATYFPYEKRTSVTQ